MNNLWAGTGRRAVVRVVLASLGIALVTMADKGQAAALEGFTCPVCEREFEALTPSPGSPIVGQDRDLMPRGAAEEPVLYEAVTCPGCLYSGYVADFAKDIAIAEDVRRAFAEGRAVKVPEEVPPEVENADLPAWARYDLAAQTMKLMGRPAMEQAFALLGAAWSERLTWRLFTVSEEQLQQFEAWERDNVDRRKLAEADNPPDATVSLAESLVQKARKTPAQGRRFPGLLAVYLLRNHGENEAALDALALLKDGLGADQFETLQKSLTASIERERSYQRRALDLLRQALVEEKALPQKATMIYLCGELCRRLGEKKDARTFFDEVRKNKEANDRLREWAKEQAARSR